MAIPDLPLAVEVTALSGLVLGFKWALSQISGTGRAQAKRIADLDEAVEERIAALETKVDLLTWSLSEERSVKHAYRNEAAAFRVAVAVLRRLRDALSAEPFYVASKDVIDLALDIPHPHTEGEDL